MNTDIQTPDSPSVCSVCSVGTLLTLLRNDPRLEKCQGLLMNLDGSLLVIHRWGGKYFPGVEPLAAWLGNQSSEVRSQKSATEATHESSNAS